MQADSRGQSGYPRRNNTPLATHFRSATFGRFNTAEDGHFGSVNLTSVLFKARIDDADHVKMEVWHAPGRTKPAFAEAKRAKYQPLKKGDSFGPSWTNHWVRVHLKVPREYQDEERVQLEFDSSCEAMVYNTEGLPLQGLTGGYNDERRVEFIIKSPKTPQTIYIEVSANEMFGIAGGQEDGPGPNVYFKLEGADIVVPRMEAWHLLWDFRILKDLARALPADSRLGNKAMYTANAMLNVFRHDDLSTISKARKIAEDVLGKGWQNRGADVYEGTKDEQIYAMSNCHIDTAWLWPFSVTQQKTARSWSTQCDLMDRYPEHRFVASQAQQFKWLEEQYPMLFDVIRQKVEDGKFMPIGGSWVENDTNMPAGEALCRQMIYGQRYFKSRFGKYCDVHWLPDTFGYSSQLPQICRLAGMDYFFTQKLSWSQFNKFPHSTFNWVGIDGSQVLTHMTPADTYNAQCMPEEVINGVKNLKNLEVSDISLLPFGNGDGGGGAVPPMLERLRRLRSIANNNPELPKVGYGKGRTVSDMYRAILKQTDDGKMLPTWMGELYLEFHRGTYTSHGSIKRHNRKSEILLKELEYLATLASLQGKGSAYVYPKGDIDPLWEKVLLCQFHDVLPGSAIGMVYEDAEKIYAEVSEKATDLLREAIKALIPSASQSISSQHDLVAINALRLPRCEVIEVPHLPWSGGSYLATQKHDRGFLAYAEDANGCGVGKLTRAAPEVPATCSYKDGEYMLTNESFEVKVNSVGRITSLVDLREDRQLISPGRSAGFVIFEDTPSSFDAWEIDLPHLETATQLEAESVKVHQAGPIRASVVCQYRHGESTWSTTISIDAVASSKDAMSMINIETDIDWRARHRFLKWEAPVEIFSSEAFYETQFGYLSRPTHRNTSWQRAMFEVCGHKYIDLSEHGYGIALLNDCKYGFAVCGNVMRISLLRSATGPDPEQDQGKHHFKFALLPHKEHFYQTRVPQIAAAYNAPMRIQAVAAGTAQSLTTTSLVRLDGAPSVILDTIKRGDDDDFMSKQGQTSVICRFYESKGGHAKAKLSFGVPIVSARIVDLLERPLSDVELKKAKDGSSVATISFRGFEVKTLQLII